MMVLRAIPDTLLVSIAGWTTYPQCCSSPLNSRPKTAASAFSLLYLKSRLICRTTDLPSELSSFIWMFSSVRPAKVPFIRPPALPIHCPKVQTGWIASLLLSLGPNSHFPPILSPRAIVLARVLWIPKATVRSSLSLSTRITREGNLILTLLHAWGLPTFPHFFHYGAPWRAQVRSQIRYRTTT